MRLLEKCSSDFLVCGKCKYNRMRSMRFTVVGDGAVGKTCLLTTYKHDTFSEEYDIGDFDTTIYVDNKEYTIKLWDTLGTGDHETLRPINFPDTDCFILCYSISEKSSYESVMTRWEAEVRHYLPDAPIILVGTKSEMRVLNSDKFVQKSDGEKLAIKIGAFAYVECSAKTKTNLHQVFEEAVRAVKSKNNCLSHCVIL